MSAKTLRIAISGPNASGKTTLANAVSATYQIPVIQEGVAPVFNAQATFNKLRRDRAPVEEVVRARARWIQSFVQWVKDRDAEYARHENFVADRWEADLLDFWLVFMRNEKDVDPLTIQFLKSLTTRAKELDLVVVMPFAAPLAGEKNDVDMMRNSSLTNRLLNSMLTTGIIHNLSNVRVLKIPPTVVSVEDRLGLIEKGLADTR